MPGWLDDNVIRAAVADAKGTTVANLTAKWNSVVTKANAFAVGTIKRAFVARGLSITDCDRWDDRAEFQHDLALWKCAVIAGHWFTRDESALLAKLNRTAELKDCPLLSGGVPMVPDTAAEESAQAGFMAGSTDMFRHPLASYPNTINPNGDDLDPLRGIVTGEL